MDRLKYVKLENEDGSYSSSIPLAVDSDHVDVNGNTLTNELNKLSHMQTNISHIDLNNKINLLENVSWNIGSGWTSITNGFAHASGATETLTTSVSIVENEPYILVFTCTNQYSSTTDEALSVEFGGSGHFEQYQDNGTVTKYFTFYPTNGDLKFTPSTNWAGNLYDIGLYKINNDDLLKPTLKIYDENDNLSFSSIVTDGNMHNIIFSNNALQMATIKANKNIAIGNNALSKTGTGYFNTAIGYNSQKESVNGTRNISVGYESLANIINGDRNIAIGTFALEKVTNGRNNIGIGADAAWYTTTGNNNIAISNGALNSNVTGSGNIALGYFANSANTTGGQNISLGHLSNAYNTTGAYNIALGYFAHYNGTNDKFNVALGYQNMSQTPLTNCEYNIALGYNAMQKGSGSHNIALGFSALKSPTNATTHNIAIGYECMGLGVTCGAEGDNVAIGHSSGRKIAGVQNIALGRGALNDACTNFNIAIGSSALQRNTSAGNIGIGYSAGQYITTGQKNIIMGYGTGNNITTASNCIILGNSINGVNQDNFISIGNEFMALDHHIGLGTSYQTNARVTIGAGTADMAPLRLNSGTLTTTPQADCIEYDGVHLYFVDHAGVRHQLSEVTS